MTEILVSRHTAEQLLERQIEKAVTLAQNGMQSQSENDYDRWIQDFERWRRMGSAVVAKIYGKGSNEQKDFENTGRILAVAVGTPLNVEQIRAVERLESRGNVLRSLVEQLELVDEPSGVALSAQTAQEPATPTPMGIFIVHGQNEAIREAVARTLEKAGREVVILHEQANKGRTLIEKFEQHAATAGNAVILLTADDVGGPQGRTFVPAPVRTWSSRWASSTAVSVVSALPYCTSRQWRSLRTSMASSTSHWTRQAPGRRLCSLSFLPNSVHYSVADPAADRRRAGRGVARLLSAHRGWGGRAGVRRRSLSRIGVANGANAAWGTTSELRMPDGSVVWAIPVAVVWGDGAGAAGGRHRHVNRPGGPSRGDRGDRGG
jgi:hypothetical protein